MSSVQVNTVRGAVDVDQLGPTLMHEHIFVLNMEVMVNHPEIWDEDLRVDEAVQKLNELKAAGIDTIVDPTVIGLGRYIPRIQKVCAQTELNVVVATGLYTYNDLPFYFHLRGPGTLLNGPEPMVEMFVRDIEEGITGTGVKAGVLKFATDAFGMTPGCERVIRACAQAHRRTGVPITTHTDPHNKSGLEQQRILREEGVDLSRVVIGHSGDTTDLDYLQQLIDNGSYIGMDRFGIDVYLPTKERVDTIVELCKRGHADRMVLAHDASCWLDWVEPVSDELRQAMSPNWNFLHISRDVLPMLRERGVPEAQIDQMLAGNPREYFSRQGAY
jgi:phosphotriesterase-related protein